MNVFAFLSHERRLRALEAQVPVLASQLTALAAQQGKDRSEMDAQLQTLTAEVTQVGQVVTNLDAALADAAQQIATLKAQVAAGSAPVDLEPLIEQLGQTVSAGQAELASLQPAPDAPPAGVAAAAAGGVT